MVTPARSASDGIRSLASGLVRFFHAGVISFRSLLPVDAFAPLWHPIAARNGFPARGCPTWTRVAPDALPRSLFAWPTFLWSRVLFPGDRRAAGIGIPPLAAERTTPLGSSLLILLIVPALLLYPCLSFPLFEPDESRYAEIPREMLQRGDWVTPRLQGEPYLEKPPLLYWLTAASYPAVRRPRLGGPAAAGPGRSRIRFGALPRRPAHLRGTGGLSRRPDAEPGARLRQHRPAAHHRRRPHVLHHAGPVRAVRGGARPAGCAGAGG